MVAVVDIGAPSGSASPVTSSSVAAAVASPASPTLVGKWSGTGAQSNGDTWPLTVSFIAARLGVCAKVDYPSVPCKADWLCTSVASPRSVEALEKLTEHEENCIPNGTMTMSLTDDDKLDWRWEGGGYTATGLLTRVSR